MDVRAIPLGKLRVAEWNANRPGPELIRKLRRSLERFGLVSNLVVRKHPTRRGAFEVLSGNHRLELLLELGVDEAPCVVVDVDDAQARLLAVTLNRGGENDAQAYSQLIADVVAALGGKTELVDLLPETDESLDVALARLEALPPPASIADRYPLVFTWKLGFKLEAALACEQRRGALVFGEDRDALAWWYGHAFDTVLAEGAGGSIVDLDFVDFDDSPVVVDTFLEPFPEKGTRVRVIALVGTAKRSLTARVRKAAAAAGAELELLALDEHDGLVYGSWRSTS